MTSRRRTRFPARFHAHRAAGGDQHHRRSGGLAACPPSTRPARPAAARNARTTCGSSPWPSWASSTTRTRSPRPASSARIRRRPLRNDPTTSTVPMWMPGQTPSATSAVPMYSWVVDILPQLDQQDLYNQWTKIGRECHQRLDSGGLLRPGSNQGGTYVVQAGRPATSRSPTRRSACSSAPTTTRPSRARATSATWSTAASRSGTSTPTAGQAARSTAPPAQRLWRQRPAMGTSDHRLPGHDRRDLEAGRVLPRIRYHLAHRQGDRLPVERQVHAGRYQRRGHQHGHAGREYACRRQRRHALFQPASDKLGVPSTNFTKFMASDNVCDPTSGDCGGNGSTRLTPVSDIDGIFWAEANKLGNFENINFGQNLTIKGSFPFTNSAIPAAATTPSAMAASSSSPTPSTARSTPRPSPPAAASCPSTASNCRWSRTPSASNGDHVLLTTTTRDLMETRRQPPTRALSGGFFW